MAEFVVGGGLSGAVEACDCGAIGRVDANGSALFVPRHPMKAMIAMIHVNREGKEGSNVIPFS